MRVLALPVILTLSFSSVNAQAATTTITTISAAPTISTAPTTSTACSDNVSSGDKSVGIWGLEDSSCDLGGLGCLNGTACRLCQATNSPKSDHLMLCTDIDSAFILPSFESSGVSGTSLACAATVSVGDQAVGISAVGTSSDACAANGLGCLDGNVCRMCWTAKTAQSGHLLACTEADSIGASTSTSTAAVGVSVTTTPTSTTTSTKVTDDTGDCVIEVGLP